MEETLNLNLLKEEKNGEKKVLKYIAGLESMAHMMM